MTNVYLNEPDDTNLEKPRQESNDQKQHEDCRGGESKPPDKNNFLSERQLLRDFFDLLLKVDMRINPNTYKNKNGKDTGSNNS